MVIKRMQIGKRNAKHVALFIAKTSYKTSKFCFSYRRKIGKLKYISEKKKRIILFRTLCAVYEVVGEPADRGKAEELFKKLDENCDGEISKEEFINIIKQDHKLLNILEKT